jgi:predicted transcriptional regulator
MPLLEINQVRQVSATIRLDENTAAQIDQYAAFLEASPDEVVDKALAYVFSKDREFQEFLKTARAGEVPQKLRIRRAPRNANAENGAGAKVANGSANAR